MKFMNKTMAFAAVIAVFGVSFAMGHISAVKSTKQWEVRTNESMDRAVAIMPLLRASDGTTEKPDVPKPSADEPAAVLTAAPDESVEEVVEEPPFPVLMPVDGLVSEPYSLQSVYSETMQDWRAHTGMDIEAQLASAVVAVAEGTVAKAYEDKLWGNVIEIEHKGGLKTVYKGVSTLSMVRVGEKVDEGKIISGVGTSPIESKAMAHLHFEIWQDGVCINPESYVVEIANEE
ncbi:MAG: M23 family metallopeptidase [Oscillospiraceae bacterium]|nr:M23 family metallopeptidase [Oscillospiraceae bacterium]